MVRALRTEVVELKNFIKGLPGAQVADADAFAEHAGKL